MKQYSLILFVFLLSASSALAQGTGYYKNFDPGAPSAVPKVGDNSPDLQARASYALSQLSMGGGSSTPAVSATTNDLGPLTATTTSSTALAASTRLNAVIVNYGANGCFISLTGTAVGGKGIYLAPGGGSYSIDANNLYRGVISVITSTGTTTLSIHEGQ